MIPFCQIGIRSDWNARLRYDTTEDDELYRSILEEGVQQPVTGRWIDEKFILSDGYRRYHVCKRIVQEGLKNSDELLIPIRTEPEGIEDRDRAFYQITLNSGKPLEAFEFMNLVYRLHHTFDFDIKEIADKSGKSEVWVCDMLALAEGKTPLLTELLENQRISVTQASELIKQCESFPDLIDRNLNKALAKSTDGKLTAKHFTDKHTNSSHRPTLRKGGVHWLKGILNNSPANTRRAEAIGKAIEFLEAKITEEELKTYLHKPTK